MRTIHHHPLYVITSGLVDDVYLDVDRHPSDINREERLQYKCPQQQKSTKAIKFQR